MEVTMTDTEKLEAEVLEGLKQADKSAGPGRLSFVRYAAFRALLTYNDPDPYDLMKLYDRALADIAQERRGAIVRAREDMK